MGDRPPRRIVVEVAERDTEARRQAEARERTYRKLEADAARKAAGVEAEAAKVLDWDAQGLEIKRLNSRAIGVIGSVIDGTASAFLSAAAGLTDSEEVREALWKLASFEQALGNLSKVSTIARTWAARGDAVAADASEVAQLTDEEIKARLAKTS